MLTGLLISRALLSITQVLCLLFALYQYKEWKPFFKKDSLLLWSCMPLLLFVLGDYQQPFATKNYDYLLTLLVYPVAALTIKSLSAETGTNAGIRTWIIIGLVSLVYPLGWYLMHIKDAALLYGRGQSLPTWMDTDHVRYGIFLCSIFLFLLYCFPFKKKLQIPLIILLLVIIVLMSVRTAWAMAFILSVSVLFVKHFPYRVIFIILLVTTVLSSFFLFPTVQKKIAYTIYDWQQFNPKTYDSNYSDGARRAINYVAVQSIKDRAGNVGWAAVPEMLQKSFENYFPAQRTSYGWPFNQWLFWWMGSGWWGMLLFSAWLFYPVIAGWKQRNIALISWTIAIAASCMVECTLHYQFGVWLHAWPIALIWEHKRDQRSIL